MDKLTKDQVSVLASLVDGPETARGIADKLSPSFGYRVSYDQIHSSLRTLENRELVRRSGFGDHAAVWELTGYGKKHLNN